jgi:hypothetical protein
MPVCGAEVKILNWGFVVMIFILEQAVVNTVVNLQLENVLLNNRADTSFSRTLLDVIN